MVIRSPLSGDRMDVVHHALLGRGGGAPTPQSLLDLVSVDNEPDPGRLDPGHSLTILKRNHLHFRNSIRYDLGESSIRGDENRSRGPRAGDIEAVVDWMTDLQRGFRRVPQESRAGLNAG